MTGKRELVAQLARYGGITRLLEAPPSRPQLLILNYHRVGDPARTPYDSGLFSCTAAELDWQVGRLKRQFQIVSLAEAAEIAHGVAQPKGTAVLITFDDGYRDNFDQAFPVLRRHGVPAAFFLPTLFVGGQRLPWWDEIAFLVKRARGEMLHVGYPEVAEFSLADRERAVVAVLKLFKRAASIETGRFLDGLSAASGVARPGADAERCFLSWDEARAMQAAGMGFGSHTHTHEILGRLPYARQVEELATSRNILERELGGEIDTLAYPVGKLDCFTEETFRALRTAGYRTAFSFYGGVNLPGRTQPFDVRREAVDHVSPAHFRLRNALYGRLGRSAV